MNASMELYPPPKDNSPVFVSFTVTSRFFTSFFFEEHVLEESQVIDPFLALFQLLAVVLIAGICPDLAPDDLIPRLGVAYDVYLAHVDLIMGHDMIREVHAVG